VAAARTVRLHHTDEGGAGVAAGAGALVFIHGWLRSGADWAPQARAFRRRHRVLRVDLRGHGRSPAPPAGYSRAELANDVAALLRRLRLSNAVLVAHSMGCGVALDVAALEPRRVRALALVDGVGPRDHRFTRRELDAHPWVRAIAGPDYEARVIALASGGNAFTERSDPRLVRRIPRESARTPQHVAVASLRDAVLGSYPAAAWKRLRQPILYVASSSGRTSATTVREVLPRAEFAQVVGAGHWVQLEATAQLNAMLRAFLRGLAS
jgi:pimeloyl-ACP methyl ester carboxylesterase